MSNEPDIYSINLNTRFATNQGSANYLTKPVWLLNESVNNISAIKLKNFTFPLSVYTIDSRNNKIAFTENADPTVKTLTLTSKNYQGFSLADELALQLNAVGINTYTVEYDLVPNTNVLTISAGSDSFTFVDVAKNAYYETGLENYLNNEYGLLTTSTVDLSGLSQVHLVSNVGGSNVIGQQFKLLAAITTEETALDVSYFQDDSNDYINSNVSQLTEINLILYDNLFRPISPQKDYSLTINFLIEKII